MTQRITIIGAGLAGSEAAWQLAQRGITVDIYEQRGAQDKSGETIQTSVHKTHDAAELVCSNSFRGTDITRNAVAVLHEELRQLDSLILKMADRHRVPAGGALAISREEFAADITTELAAHPLITIHREEITDLPADRPTIVATGPLTSSALADAIVQLTGEDRIAFFDAVAPIVQADTIDMDIAWKQSRYDKGDGADYINCPMSEEQYRTFVEAIVQADQAIGHNPEDANIPFFEACLPIEVMAERGAETLRFGPLKPVGLTNPHNPTVKPYAIVQLRQDNKLGTLFNMVGFQTKMKWGEQKRIFATIPGLENAEFARMGVIHKNTFINSPSLLDEQMRLKAQPNLRFAGQVTGVEGYVESTAMGMLAALFSAADLTGATQTPPPPTTMLGGLLTHITGGADAKTFQPMNITYGLLPELGFKHKKKERKQLYGERALEALATWKGELADYSAAA